MEINYDLNSGKIIKDNYFSIDENFFSVVEILKERFNNQNKVILTANPSRNKRYPIDASETINLRANYSDILKPYYVNDENPKKSLLKNYQKEGVRWLLKTGSGILADDMGLGKTAQAIIAANKYIKENPSSSVLILCPGTLIKNWYEELSFWSENYYSISIEKNDLKSRKSYKQLIPYTHFLIMSYESGEAQIEEIKENPPSIVIADEVHKLRKSTSNLYKAFSKVKWKKFWGLSGTPIENNLSDLKNLMKLIQKLKFGNINKYSDLEIKALSKTFILRRDKAQVLKDLPKSKENIIRINLSPQQKKQYLEIKEEIHSANQRDFIRLFNKLRTICDLDLSGRYSAKADKILDVLDKIYKNKEKVIVFSFNIEPLLFIQRNINEIYKRTSNVFVSGEDSLDDRARLIKKFKTDEKCFVLLCSARVGSEGLNLTEANNVIFFNEWWNPSLNDQARDRVIRIGQKKNVEIYKFRQHETIENRLEQIQNLKMDLTKKMISPTNRKFLETLI